MKNGFYTILLFAVICGVFAACTGGNYNASPDNNANGAVNPLTPLTSSQFTWTGTDPISATINGVPWVASLGTWSFDTAGGGANVLTGVSGSTVVQLYLSGVYAGNIYGMNYHDYGQFVDVSDSVSGAYYSYSSVYGNSGEVQIVENDSARIKGYFYAKCLTPSGQVLVINNGYFNLPKY